MNRQVSFAVPQFAAKFSLRLVSWIERISPPEWATVMTTALVVGLGAGFGAIVFHKLIEVAQWLFFDRGAQVFGFLGDYYILIIPALGGLLGGPLVVFFAREAKGHGVPEVMEAVALRGGRIRPRVAVIKSVASSICIGSGGSVGSEGPIVQIGAALGSTVGQVMRLSDERVRSLVACGAAGGIAAVFNAPIAGTIFALEVIMGEFRSTYFGAVVISAVIADVVVHIFEGSARAFAVPSYQLANPSELVLYALLGVIAAPVAVGYGRVVEGLDDVFTEWKGVPDYLKAMIGGLLVGVLGAIVIFVSRNVAGAEGLTFEWMHTGGTMPAMFGIGYEIVNPALLGQIGLGTALTLLVLKMAVTGLTLGSGGSGGIFAPGLFIGAMLGVSFGHIVNMIFPGSTAPAGAYALVGMAAVFAGTAHAPATAILILFEMTGDYNIILPLMFATVISLLLAKALQTDSIYTLKLSRRGIKLQAGRDVDLMEGVTVAEAMHTEYDVVSPSMTLPELIEEFDRTHHHGFPVVNEDGTLIGIVTLTDLSASLGAGEFEGRTVRDIATRDGMLVAFPDESLATAMLRMGVRGVGRLPVISREEPQRFVGMLRREGMIRAYNRAVARRSNISHRLRTLQQHGSENVNVIEVSILPSMECAGKALREVATNLPDDCIVASVQRGGRILIPHGDTVLEPGDRLTLLASRAHSELAVSAFC